MNRLILLCVLIACSSCSTLKGDGSRGNGGAAASASGAAAAPARAEEGPVRIGYTPLIYAQPTFVALSKKLFDAEGVKTTVTQFENSTQIVNAVLAGQLDFCAISPALSVFSAESKRKGGKPLFKFYYYNLDSKEHPISFLLTKKDSKIQDLKDLKGKSVGIFPGNLLSRVSMRLLLRGAGLGKDDTTFQEIAPQLQAQSLQGGQVDVLFSLEPFATVAMEKVQAKVLHVAPQITIAEPLPGGAGFMSAAFVAQRPDAARRFYRAIQKATAIIRSDPAFAKRVLTEYTPLDPSLSDKVRQPEYHIAEEMGSGLLQKEYDALVKESVLEGPLDTKELVYDAG